MLLKYRIRSGDMDLAIICTVSFLIFMMRSVYMCFCMLNVDASLDGASFEENDFLFH